MSLPYILSFLCPPSFPGVLLSWISLFAPINLYMRHLPYNTACVEKFGVSHRQGVHFHATAALAGEQERVLGLGVEERFVVLRIEHGASLKEAPSLKNGLDESLHFSDYLSLGTHNVRLPYLRLVCS